MEGIISSLVALSIIFSARAGYVCEPESCHGLKHTLCLYDANDFSKCNELQVNYLTEEEKKGIIKAHNDYRALVASGGETRGYSGPQPGGNIPPLQWDDELSTIAQVWADQCQNGHSACDDTDQFTVNQNIAFTSKSNEYETDIVGMFQQWSDEANNFDGNLVNNMPNQEKPKIFHYTQLVWADTKYVGCGLVKYRDPSNDWYNTRLICNYGPAGNVVGQPLYPTSSSPQPSVED